LAYFGNVKPSSFLTCKWCVVFVYDWFDFCHLFKQKLNPT